MFIIPKRQPGAITKKRRGRPPKGASQLVHKRAAALLNYVRTAAGKMIRVGAAAAGRRKIGEKTVTYIRTVYAQYIERNPKALRTQAIIQVAGITNRDEKTVREALKPNIPN